MNSAPCCFRECVYLDCWNRDTTATRNTKLKQTRSAVSQHTRLAHCASTHSADHRRANALVNAIWSRSKSTSHRPLQVCKIMAAPLKGILKKSAAAAAPPLTRPARRQTPLTGRRGGSGRSDGRYELRTTRREEWYGDRKVTTVSKEYKYWAQDVSSPPMLGEIGHC